MTTQKILKTILQTLLVASAVVAVFLLPVAKMPSPAHAQLSTAVEIPYGGHELFWITCLCSKNSLHFIFDYRTLQVLPLVYQPGSSVLYLYYNLFGRYFLGSHQPSGECLVLVVKICVPIPSEGTMGSRPGTGTSL
ncbi:MAG: hypothetical protein AAB846_02760 [Patescibacteria group bacterium]